MIDVLDNTRVYNPKTTPRDGVIMNRPDSLTCVRTEDLRVVKQWLFTLIGTTADSERRPVSPNRVIGQLFLAFDNIND
jgi:hypothetical protein